MKQAKTSFTARTLPEGAELLVSDGNGLNLSLPLSGTDGFALAAAILRALEPHYPIGDDPKLPMATALFFEGFHWQAGLQDAGKRAVHLNIRPSTSPGILFAMPGERAANLGKALIDLSTAAKTPRTAN